MYNIEFTVQDRYNNARAWRSLSASCNWYIDTVAVQARIVITWQNEKIRTEVQHGTLVY